MNFRKYIVIFTIFASLFSISNVSAIDIKIGLNSVKTTKVADITRKDFFVFLANYFNKDIPKSYKYINLSFKDITNDSELKDALQVLVYVDVIKNKDIKIYWDRTIGAYLIYKFIEDNLEIYATPEKETVDSLKKRNANTKDLEIIKSTIDNIKLDINVGKDLDKLSDKKKIFSDIYETLLKSHYDKDNLSEDKLINWAIEWLTKATEDKFTTYFPPTENKNFEEDLNWKYEWIWAYVDMEIPWEFKIISPISWTPSEKAWLKWWDIVLSVDSKKVTIENTLKEVVSWVKWPAWTKVKLEIKRWTEIFFVEIERAKIEINEVEYKSLNSTTYYIQIKSFWDSVAAEFSDAIDDLASKNNIKNVVIDLRNNPWWYLDQVVEMLWFFVEKDEAVAVVKYKDYKTAYKSKWNSVIDFNKYHIYILQNWGTASASEIMIWTIKDYFPLAKLVWENTYWKGSVQTIKPYSDWSSLKYTVAKWFTGKTEIWINWVWIKPDIEIKIDTEKVKEWYDNQLIKVLDLINN